MPIDFEILEKMGTTQARLKEIATAVMPESGSPLRKDRAYMKKVRKDIETRQYLENKIRLRLNEHVIYSLQNYPFYSAVDLAWDSNVITKATIPLILFAQGKLSVSSCGAALSALPNGSQYVKKDSNGVITQIDLPKFLEVNINLVRSICTRRLAAQSNKFSNLWPYYNFEARGTSQTAKLRGEALSQAVDIVVDEYGDREHSVQVMRDMFLYSHGVDFVRSSWECEQQYRKDAAGEAEAYYTKEGISFFNPHPSRIYYDTAYPLSSINSDTGCEYIGYWDIQRFGALYSNPAYYNKEAIKTNSAIWGIYSQYQAYFNQYFTTIRPPTDGAASPAVNDPAGANDLKNLTGLYTNTMMDYSVLYSEYFEKLVPSAHGIGDYPFPVWVRFVTAGEGTIVYSEIMPSTPAAFCGHNIHDGRQLNLSIAHEIMGYQDQMNNLNTALLKHIQIELLTIVGLNTDGLDPEDVKVLEQRLRGKDWSTDPIVLKYSLSKLGDSGVLGKAQDVVQIAQAKSQTTQGTIESIIKSMAQLVALMEKLLSLSPAEQGQPAPREISATEVNAISDTTTSVYSFISDAIDSYRAAKKRIYYESMVAKKQGILRVPVINRYTEKTVIAAGFEVVTDENESALPYKDSQRRTIMGRATNLIYPYTFTTRDGAERAASPQVAQVLIQGLTQVLQLPGVMQAMGKEKLYEILNEFFRKSGTGVDLNLQMKEGEDDKMGEDQLQQLGQFTQQLAQQFQQLVAEVQKQGATLQQTDGTLHQLGPEVATLAKQFQATAQKVSEMQQANDSTLQKIIATVAYDKAPPDVQRQLEGMAGLHPSILLPPPPKPITPK